MMTSIGKSGTGIGKSGTGIGKSGTGIGKSGTGAPAGRGWLLAAIVAALLLFVVGQASAEPGLLITEHDGNVVVSLHAGSDLVVGSARLTGEYQVFALHRAMVFDDQDAQFRTLIKGSGSGASGESDQDSGYGLLIKGSGSGASGEANCQEGASLMIKGSGSGASGESGCESGASLMIKGSGSGASGESSCDSGASLMIKGSGSGASGESAPGCGLPAGSWGLAEVVVDGAGMHIMIHRAGSQGLTEFLVAFIESASDRPSAVRPDFVAVP